MTRPIDSKHLLPTCGQCGRHYRLPLDDHQGTQACAGRRGARVLEGVVLRQAREGRARVFKQYLPFLKRLGIPWVEDYVKVEVQPVFTYGGVRRHFNYALVMGYYANAFVVAVAHNNQGGGTVGWRERLIRRSQDYGLEALEARWRLEKGRMPRTGREISAFLAEVVGP